jgi:hypothetical protein
MGYVEVLVQAQGRFVEHAVRLLLAASVLITPAVARAQASSSQTPSFDTSKASKDHDVAGAIVDAFKLVSIEHLFRITFQEKTRAELGGPFWSDYQRSVRIPQQWEDTDAWGVNYLGHPIHGAAAGLIWLDHCEKSRGTSMFSEGYLSSKARAAVFSAIYSVQFEIGPISEASIGNVGFHPETAGWVDYVVTPLGAFGIMIAEDALDRYVVQRIEDHVQNRAVRVTARLFFGPSRMLANAAEGRLPWNRAGRPLSGK